MAGGSAAGNGSTILWCLCAAPGKRGSDGGNLPLHDGKASNRWQKPVRSRTGQPVDAPHPAVWPCFAAHSASGKILAVLFPIPAFVALGFEHCVANMYLIPVGLFADGTVPDAGDLMGSVQNIAVVTLGNIVGGTVLVASVYWLVYLRHRQ